MRFVQFVRLIKNMKQRHELSRFIGNATSDAINISSDGRMIPFKICIPAEKTINELYEMKIVRPSRPYESLIDNSAELNHNALSFERMIAMILGCVSPRPLSGLDDSLTGYNLVIIYVIA